MNIYMDYQASTPCDRRVLEKMLPYFCDVYANPYSHSHNMGLEAAEAVEQARRDIADALFCSDVRSVVFTSGATEANNMAIKGAARYYRKARGNKVITSAIEHKCVIESVQALSREGFEVVYLPVQADGLINLDELRSEIDESTVLVSIMHANNEIGVVQPIEQIGRICRESGVLFHTDAAQSFGKIPLRAEWADMISLSGHKIYGPKGVGALYVSMNPRIRLSSLIDGGGQERGMRSGTVPVPLCVGFAEAARLCIEEMGSENERLLALRERLFKKITSSLEKVYVNGSLEHRLAGNLNISFYGVEGESVMLRMPGVCISSGSACTSLSLDSSHVIKALNVKDDLAHSSLRFSLGRFTTQEEVDYVAQKTIDAVNDLRAMSPLW